MCNGTIMDKLISFSLPLMLSGILQLMFNAVDIIVVGRFSGSQALAAVGSTTALINVFTNLFIGISLGANVLAARFYAAGKDREMSDTVHTAVTLALVSGIVMAFVGLIFSRWALELMGTPDDVIGQSALYMKIYFLGMPFFMLYNYGAAILRAVGDTKRPLIFLVISGVVNAVLNLILVIMFHMDVAGVAIATVISQLISCILVLRCLRTSKTSYQLHFGKLRINTVYLKQIFQVGIPAGIQSTVINLSNALLQSSVNSFGSTAMAGYTAANNIFGFLYVAVNSVTQAPFYAVEDIAYLCPECIANGEAARKYDGSFQDDFSVDDGVDDPEKLDELIHRTPGYSGWQQEYWRAHCGDYCAYLGHVGARELRALGVLEEVLDDPMWDDEQKEMIRESVNGGHLQCYLFQCLHCGKHLVWMDFD